MLFLRDSLRQTAARWPLAVVRILYGHMWVGTSMFWLGADDRAASLSNQVTPLLESGRRGVDVSHDELRYGQSFLSAAGNTLDFWVSFALLVTAAGRAFGIDYWLHRRWERVPVW